MEKNESHESWINEQMYKYGKINEACKKNHTWNKKQVKNPEKTNELWKNKNRKIQEIIYKEKSHSKINEWEKSLKMSK